MPNRKKVHDFFESAFLWTYFEVFVYPFEAFFDFYFVRVGGYIDAFYFFIKPSLPTIYEVIRFFIRYIFIDLVYLFFYIISLYFI